MSENQLENILQQYINILSEKEQKAYQIAKHHLGSSFHLEKSKGFIEWKHKNIRDIK